jgi:hypothetical protein
LLFGDYYCTWILFGDGYCPPNFFGDYYYPPHLFGDYYCTHCRGLLRCFLGIITVLDFGDYSGDPLKPASTVFPPNCHSNSQFGVTISLWESRSTSTSLKLATQKTRHLMGCHCCPFLHVLTNTARGQIWQVLAACFHTPYNCKAPLLQCLIGPLGGIRCLSGVHSDI